MLDLPATPAPSPAVEPVGTPELSAVRRPPSKLPSTATQTTTPSSIAAGVKRRRGELSALGAGPEESIDGQEEQSAFQRRRLRPRRMCATTTSTSR